MICSKGGNWSGGRIRRGRSRSSSHLSLNRSWSCQNSARVRGVDQHRDPQLARLVPQRRQTRVVHRDPVAVGVPVGHAKPLEDLQARGAVPRVLFQLRGGPFTPAGLAHAPEAGIGEEDEARRMPPGHGLEPRGQRGAAAAGEVHHDRHVEFVHLLHQTVHVGSQHVRAALMAVNVHEGEARPRERVLRDDQGVARLVIDDRDVLGAGGGGRIQGEAGDDGQEGGQADGRGQANGASRRGAPSTCRKRVCIGPKPMAAAGSSVDQHRSRSLHQVGRIVISR